MDASSSRNATCSLVTAALPAMLAVVALAGCAGGAQRLDTPIGLERRTTPFNQGRINVVVQDEMGVVMPGMRVDLTWDEPSFYTTSAFTNRQGEVSFSGVPQVAELTVDHPGGRFSSLILVPDSGRPEFRIMLDTRGGGQMMREQERARMTPQPQPQPTPRGGP